MARYSIYSSDDVLKATGTPTYTGAYMKPGVLTFREISSPTPIEWEEGDYVAYDRTTYTDENGDTQPYIYKLYSVPQVKKQARNSRYGGAFVYNDVQFYDDLYLTTICIFRDIVLGDNRIHFSTQPSISVVEDVAGIAERLQVCLNDGYGTWAVRLATEDEGASSDLVALMEETKEFVVSGATIADCLTKIYELWPGVGYVYRKEVVDEAVVNTIILGGAGLSSGSEVYAYGKGSGLTSLTRTLANKDEYANRLYAYGSARNMVSGWYSLNYDIKDGESVDIQHLMLPVSTWGTTDDLPDPAQAYIQDGDPTVIHAKSVYFDGSGDEDEIYPTIRKITAGEIRTVMDSEDDYYPSTSLYDDDDRMDTVLSVISSFDDGLAGDSVGSAVKQTGTFDETSPSAITMEEGVATITSTIFSHQFHYSGETASCEVYASSDISGTVTLSSLTSAILRLSLVMRKGSTETTLAVNDIELSSSGTTGFSLSPNSVSRSDVSLTYSTTYIYIIGELILRRGDVASEESVSVTLSGTTYYTVKKYRSKTFQITIPQIGFNIEEQAALGSGKTIYMASGQCVGRSFKIKSCSYLSDSDSWQLTVIRGEDESLSQWFPNSTYPIAAEDEFVLLDIAMPSLYVGIAEERLLAAAQELYAWTSTKVWQYTPEIDAIYMANNPSRVITPGEYIVLSDTELSMDSETLIYFLESSGGYFLTASGEKILLAGSGYTAPVMVDTLTINEGDAEIPTYKVTLRERKKKSHTSYAAPSVTELTSVEDITSSSETSSSTASDYFEIDPDLASEEGVSLKEDYYWFRAEKISIGGTYTYTEYNEDTEEDETITDNAYLSYDSDNLAWHLHGNLYADGFITAGGVNSDSSSGGSASLAEMWYSLQYNTGTYAGYTINSEHLPDLPVATANSAGAVQVGSGLTITDGVLSVTSEGTTYTAGTGIDITSSVISIDSTYQGYISNGVTAYGWGDHSGLYLLLTGGDVTGATTFADTVAVGSTLTIGTTTAQSTYPLYVTGDSYLNGSVGVNGAPQSSYTFYVSGTSFLGGNVVARGTFTVGTSASNKATTLYGTLDVTDLATFEGDIRLKDSTNYGRTIYFGDDSYVYLSEVTDDALTIYARSGVTISSALTASSTLDVTGATTLSSTLSVTGATTLSSTLGVTGATTLSSTLGVTGATTLSSTLDVTDDTTLSADLTVSGDTKLAGDLWLKNGQNYGSKIVFGNKQTSTDYVYISEDTDDHLTIYGRYGITLNVSSTSYKVLIGGNAEIDGTLYLGGTSAYMQYVSGNSGIYTNVGFYSDSYITAGEAASSSDARLKDEIEDVSEERAISVLSALRPKEWVWNERNQNLAGKRSSGLIAQDVQDVLPFIVKRTGVYYAINYSALHAYEIAGLQNHERRIKELDSRVAELEKENETLKAKLGYV